MIVGAQVCFKLGVSGLVKRPHLAPQCRIPGVLVIGLQGFRDVGFRH